MKSEARPLSPHLQIYKPQITSVLSITHRATGIFLSLGALIISCWLVGLAIGEQAFTNLQQHISAWYGKILLMAFVFSIYYHMANGIRHLFWDAGLGFDISTTYKTGYTVIILTIIMTVLTFLLGENS